MSKAPRWLDPIQRVCCDAHRDESTHPQRAIPVGRQLTILSLFGHMLPLNTSTNFQSVMGLYIYQGGARRRVLDTLCQLGLTMSYSTLQRRMSSLSDEARRKIRTIGRASTTVVTYDNFVFAEGRRGERIGDVREFRSITTALIFEGQGLGVTVLRQNMWQPENYPLSAI